MDEEKELRLKAILNELKEDYAKADGVKDRENLLYFLTARFFPQVRTKSDSGDFDYETKKYNCFCEFIATHKASCGEQLDFLCSYLNMDSGKYVKFFAKVDIYAMIIKYEGTDEELGNDHMPWYSEDSDNHYESVRTKPALWGGLFEWANNDRPGRLHPVYALVNKIADMIES